MYEYENRTTKLRQTMQHETATKHLIEQCKPHRTIVRAALLQSMLEVTSPFHVLIHLHLGSRLCVALEPLLQSMVVV